LRPRKALVTGSDGVLGRRLLAELKTQNIEAVCFKGDITVRDSIQTQINQIETLDCVFHLAAIVPTGDVERARLRAAEVNAWGTLALMTALYENENTRSAHVLYASSSHVYASSVQPLSETSACRPMSAYGLTKYQGEHSVLSFAECVGTPVTIARIFSLYDEKQAGSYLYPAWKARVAAWDQASVLEVPSGESVRDFSHASSIARQLVALACTKPAGVINVGSGHHMTVREFLLAQFGSNLRLRSVGDYNTLIPDLCKLQHVLGETY
jgi:nucleoside-diphosphate-sugar epimerase